jgi:hypothetical protein
MKEYAVAKATYDAEMRRFKSDTEKGQIELDCPEEPEEAIKPQLIIDDFTMEALIEVLGNTDRGTFIYADEITSVIGGLDAYKSAGIKKDRGIFLSGRSGIQYNSIRKGRSIDCNNLSFSVFGAITHEKFAAMAPMLVDDGCLQRFSLVPVDTYWEQPTRKPPNMFALETYKEMIRELALLNAPEDGLTVKLSKEAEKYNNEVFEITDAMSKLPYFSSYLREHASKLHGFYAGIVMTMHMIESSPAARGYSGAFQIMPEVSGETAKMARDLLMEFLIPHAIKLYQRNYGAGNELDDVDSIANHLLAHEPPYKTVAERDLKRANNKFNTKNKTKLYDATEQLESMRWLVRLPGRSDKVRKWSVNPEIYTKFAVRREEEIERRDALQIHLNKRHRIVENKFGTR